tara:strand:- start:73 stop:675 length:603 start_codon:yes stop_codon:yes gene_type:complete
MENIGFVYKWNDFYNGKYYIGSHLGDVNDGYVGSGSYFKKAYNKRKDFFSREILYVGKDYIELEEFFLKELDAMNDKNSYNLTNNARGVSIQSEESKLKISQSKKGNTYFSKEHRRKLSEKKKGKLHPCYKTNGYVKGMKHSEESKLKMSKERSRRVFCKLKNKTYQSVKDASLDLGASISHINNMINGYKVNKYQLTTI